MIITQIAILSKNRNQYNHTMLSEAGIERTNDYIVKQQNRETEK